MESLIPYISRSPFVIKGKTVFVPPSTRGKKEDVEACQASKDMGKKVVAFDIVSKSKSRPSPRKQPTCRFFPTYHYFGTVGHI
jgi:hypothetical protein